MADASALGVCSADSPTFHFLTPWSLSKLLLPARPSEEAAPCFIHVRGGVEFWSTVVGGQGYEVSGRADRLLASNGCLVLCFRSTEH
jgi:hypothetical protein